jgi:hypothetical protein
VGCCLYQLYRLFQTPHSFRMTIFTLGFRLFFILLQINLFLHGIQLSLSLSLFIITQYPDRFLPIEKIGPQQQTTSVIPEKGKDKTERDVSVFVPFYSTSNKHPVIIKKRHQIVEVCRSLVSVCETCISLSFRF